MRSHRWRLTIVATLATAALVGPAFVGVLAWARADRLSVKRTQMSNVVDSLIDPDTGRVNHEEAAENHPGLEIRVEPAGSNSASRFFKRDDRLTMLRVVGPDLVEVNADWRDSDSAMRTFAMILFAMWAPISLAAGAITWYAASAVFRPLDDLVEQAKRGERLTTTDLAEFRDLVERLNATLERERAAAKREERFVQDAAHELRTPLAILRTQLETLALRPRSASEVADAHTVMLEEVDRMCRIAEYLLASARPATDSDVAPLDTVVRHALEPWIARRPERIEVRFEPTNVQISAAEADIVVGNLVANALRYAELVRVTVVGRSIIVEDDGPGFPPDFVERAFDRFSRPENARTREYGGAGLGLAICRRVAQAHGGDVHIERSDLGGARVVIHLGATHDA